ncbi:hypothetical protein O181_076550 [Austropuccinia psidii MF-1]|uniref:Reverse transcriptase Ty1/copia-type domain-containing protein n=1 Tax=Austropuccinia psidii MF-1 TaxID=1389203 RepID=A0A9Q3F8X9_9BASI|nr:hypothetical protein [Austropuccinia psidii MF-1]
MKDLGELQYLLGMTVKRDREKRSLFLSQELYINNLLATFGMQACRPVSTLQVPGSRLLPRADTNAPAASINYQRAIGLLNYLVTCTRPDLAYSASCLAQFLNNPSSENETSFKHVLPYLSGTQTWGITLEKLWAQHSNKTARELDQSIKNLIHLFQRLKISDSTSRSFCNMNDSPKSYTTLSQIKNLEKLNSSNFISWKRSIVASLGMRNLEHLLNPGKPDNEDLKHKQIVFYFIVGHLDAENYDKFISEYSKDPSKLWCSIKEHYSSTSAENVASHLGKPFSIKFPSSSSGLSESSSLFCSTLKLLFSLSPNLFTGDVMPQVLAFYVLQMLPESCRHVSTAVFHPIKFSTKIPAVEKVFKEVELDIL